MNESPAAASARASPFTCVLDQRASLGESPVWSIDEQVLYFVDINAPSIVRFDPARGTATSMPMPSAIGCMALRRGGGFIVALRDGIFLVARDGAIGARLAAPPYDPAHEAPLR